MVGVCDNASACVGHAEELAPCIVGLVGYDSVTAVSELYNIALEIEYIVIFGRSGVRLTFV